MLKLLGVNNPDSKVHRANVGHIWGRQDPGGPHVDHMNFAIWEVIRNLFKGRSLDTCLWGAIKTI